MRCIYFQETESKVNGGPYDEIVPFWKGGGHNLHADAAPTDVYESSYETIYNRLIKWIVEEPRSKNWEYRGVNLLWCYKYQLFIHAHYAFLLHRAFDASMRDRDPSKTTVVVDDFLLGSGEPKLHEILAFSRHRDRFKTEARPVAPIVDAVKKKLLKDCLWPQSLRFGQVKKARVALYADLFKFENLIREIGAKNICAYSTVRAPKVFGGALRLGSAFYQTAEPANQPIHQNLPAYLRNLQSLKPPAGFELEGLDLGNFCVSRLKRAVSQELNSVLAYIDAAHHFFESAGSLRSALLDEDISMKKNIFCQTAAQYKVTTYIKAHGALGGKIGFLPLTAHKIFVWGRQSQKKLQAWGGDPSRAVVSGCSWYEKYLRMDAGETRKKVLSDLGLDASMPVIIFAVHSRSVLCFNYENVIRQTVDWALGAILKKENCQFVIKLHHGEPDPGFYERWAASSGIGKRVVITKTYNPYLLALAADAVISHHSTYAVDAFVLGKPVICLRDTFVGSCIEEYKKYGIFREVYSEPELSRELNTLLEKKMKEAQAANRAEALNECLNISPGTPSAVKIMASYLLEGTPV